MGAGSHTRALTRVGCRLPCTLLADVNALHPGYTRHPLQSTGRGAGGAAGMLRAWRCVGGGAGAGKGTRPGVAEPSVLADSSLGLVSLLAAVTSQEDRPQKAWPSLHG